MLTSIFVIISMIASATAYSTLAEYNSQNEKNPSDYLDDAEQGNNNAQFTLGIMYKEGDGVEQDDIQAVTWLKKAAEQGHMEAQFTLGNMCEKGQGVAQDNIRAAYWYKKAAEQGRSNTQSNLTFASKTASHDI
ncbi:hypothetical protein C1141_17200 [Vibrio agarivorans]|nr:hypothetical protein C1141_17200 [Vibrio agarivorans]